MIPESIWPPFDKWSKPEGVKEVAEKTQLSKETLYRTLSSRGNPTIKTLTAVLRATGLKMAVSANH